MAFQIRNIVPGDFPLLKEFLYEAIFVPEGVAPPPRSVVNRPELQIYFADFGSRAGDLGLVAESGSEVVGMVWCRLMHDYGHLDDDTPSLALAVREPFRSNGIGSALLQAMLLLLKQAGYPRVSLSVQKANRAVHLYRRQDFIRSAKRRRSSSWWRNCLDHVPA